MTGASGYVGSVVTELVIAEGYDVYALSRTETSDAKLRSLGAVPVRGDLPRSTSCAARVPRQILSYISRPLIR